MSPAASATGAAMAPWSRPLALLAAVGLVVLGLAWELWLAPTGRGTLAVKVLPIALAIPGLAVARLRTFRWACLVVWLYVGEGLVRATSERGPSVALASAEVAIGVVFFVACASHIRARQRVVRR